MHIDTPIGPLSFETAANGLVRIVWGRLASPTENPSHELSREVAAQLGAYFKGRLTQFDLPLAPAGTPFQARVWQAVAAIPFGKTARYGDIATDIGSGPRAVGNACGRNPIPIVIPCHRIVAAGRKPGGYSGHRGLTTKTWLLDHERNRVPEQPSETPFYVKHSHHSIGS